MRKQRKALIIVLAFICVLSAVFAFGCSQKITYYTVTFMDGQMQIGEPVKVQKGKRIEEYPTAERSDPNYVFDGWFKDDGLTKVWNLAIERVIKDITLWANFLYVPATPSNVAMDDTAFSNTLTWLQRDITPDSEFTVELAGTNITSAGKEEFVFENYKGHSDILTVKWTPAQKPLGGVYSATITSGNTEGVTVDGLMFKGAGTLENPYLLTSQTDLSAVNTHNIDEGYYYKLEQSLTARLSSTVVMDKTFNGNLNGNGKTITLEASDCGLFGSLGENAEVKDLTVAGAIANIQTDCAGVIAALNRGKISDCTVSASLDSTLGTVGTLNGDKDGIEGGVAGVAGVNYGEIYRCTYSGTVKSNVGGAGIVVINNGTVSLCSFAGTVGAANSNETGNSTKAYSYIGGIAAINYAVIEKSSIDGSGKLLAQRGEGGLNDNVGGIVAINQSGATVRECWFDGIRVHGNRNVGGIAGVNAGIITHCYAGGDYHSGSKSHSYVGGLSEVGGIVGFLQESGKVSNCFVTSNVYAYSGNAYKVAQTALNSIYLGGNLDSRDGIAEVIASEDNGNIRIELSGDYSAKAYPLVLTAEQLAVLNGGAAMFENITDVCLVCENKNLTLEENVLSVALWTRYVKEETAIALFDAFKTSLYYKEGYQINYKIITSTKNDSFKTEYDKGAYNVVFAYKADAVDKWQTSRKQIYIYSEYDKEYTTLKVGLNSAENVVEDFGVFLETDAAKKIMNPAYVPDNEADDIEITLMNGATQYGEKLTVSNATGAEKVNLPNDVQSEDGYAFAGWALTADVREGEILLKGNKGYGDLSAFATEGKLTLYARFTANSGTGNIVLKIAIFDNSNFDPELADKLVVTFKKYCDDNNLETKFELNQVICESEAFKGMQKAEFSAKTVEDGYGIAIGFRANDYNAANVTIADITIKGVTGNSGRRIGLLNKEDKFAKAFFDFVTTSTEAAEILNPQT